jgi:hypothetical protein
VGADFAVEAISIHAEVRWRLAEAYEAWREGEWLGHGHADLLGALCLAMRMRAAS